MICYQKKILQLLLSMAIKIAKLVHECFYCKNKSIKTQRGRTQGKKSEHGKKCRGHEMMSQSQLNYSIREVWIISQRIC